MDALQEIHTSLIQLPTAQKAQIIQWLCQLQLQETAWQVAEERAQYDISPDVSIAKPKLYLETTIPSYLTSWLSRDLIRASHQQLTRDWWQLRKDHFDICISDYVLSEVAAGDTDAAKLRLDLLSALNILEATSSVDNLAQRLIEEACLPRKAVTDAHHIAIATVHDMDYLLTWNCRHIANAEMTLKIRMVCESLGFRCPIICTPEELMGSYNDERAR